MPPSQRWCKPAGPGNIPRTHEPRLPRSVSQPTDIDAVETAFAAHGYVADRDLATAVFLSLALGRPLLLEGEAGVGKTEVARTLAAVHSSGVIPPAGYEGAEVNTP